MIYLYKGQQIVRQFNTNPLCQSLSTPICYISLSRITVTVMVYRFSAWLVRIPQIPDEITTFFCHLRSQWLRSLGHFKNQASFLNRKKKKKKKKIRFWSILYSSRMTKYVLKLYYNKWKRKRVREKSNFEALIRIVKEPYRCTLNF